MNLETVLCTLAESCICSCPNSRVEQLSCVQRAYIIDVMDHPFLSRKDDAQGTTKECIFI